MKAIVAILLIATVLGIFQRRTISTIRRETRELKLSQLHFDKSEPSEKRTPEQESADRATIEAIVEKVEQLIAQDAGGQSNAQKKLPELMLLLNTLSSRGITELLASFDHQPWPSDAKDSMRFLVLQSWATRDPVAAASAALSWHESLEDDDEVRTSLMALMLVTKAWAKNDPQAALDWIEREKPQEDQAPEIQQEFDHVIAAAKLAASAGDMLDWLVDAPAHRQKRIMTTAVERMDTPEERLAFARRFAKKASDQPSMETLQGPVAESLLKRSIQASDAGVEEIEAVLELILVTQPEKLLAQATLTTINEGTATRLSWLVDRYGDHPEVRRAIAGRFAIWAQKDHRAAAGWLKTLAPSPLKDEGISRFAQSVIYAEPESAVDWARTISAEALRTEVLGKIKRVWTSRAPEAADAYFTKPNS